MSRDNPNFVALDWLIGEINETLAQARQQLETFASDSSAADTSADSSGLLKNCLNLIHQVHGSLHMAELTGAAMLAEEMEQLVQALASGEVENSDETREFLMRALLELPLYLEKIAFQRRDNAVLLLPLLNDLRAVRRERLITEGALFSPDLSALEFASGARQPLLDNNIKLQELVAKLRKMYHVAAASLIRDVNSGESIAYLNKVCEKMVLLYSGSQRQHLWEILRGLLEAIADHRVSVLPALRQLLRRIDVEFRLLAGQGARALDARPDHDLIRNLLFYVYLAGPNGTRTEALYRQFALDQAVPGTPRPDTEDALAMGPEAMGTAVAALREELANVREALDPSVTTGERPPLSDTAVIAKRIADTLGVLGLENQRTRARAIYEYLRDASRSIEPDELLMQAASELVQLDSGLAAAMERDRRNDSESPLMGEATSRVLREARIGLETVKEAVVEYIASHWDAGHLSLVPKRLQEVYGGLDMVGYQRAAEIVGACKNYIEERLINAGDQPDWKLLDTLADAVTSVEYYLERRADGIEDADMLLALAEDSVATLGYAVANGEGAVEPGHGNGDASNESHSEVEDFAAEFVFEEPGTVDGELNDAPVDEEQRALDSFEFSLDIDEVEPADDNDSAAEPDAESENLLSSSLAGFSAALIEEAKADAVIESNEDASSLLEESWFASEDAADLAESAIGEDAEETASSLPESPVVTPAPMLEEDDDSSIIDEEILEIFLEEAAEVLDTINHYFPLWAANFDNRDALVEFRRGFHTLKGSGRMVEALEVGELAWAVENMLNRVLDETVTPGRAHVLLIERVMAKLPSMIEGFRTHSGDPDPAGTAELDAWAKQLSHGEVPEALLQSTPRVATSVVEKMAVGAVDDGVDDSVDDNAQLWEIFAQEAETHLATVAEFLSEMERAAPVYGIPSDPLHRALHTLKGSAHMAEVTQVAELMAPLERFAKELRTYQVAIDSDIFELISDAASYVKSVLNQIYRGEPLHVERSEQYLARVAELQERAVGHLIREREANEPKAVDPQLLAVIMADGMKVLLDADQMLSQWRSHPGDTSILLPVAEELDVLQQAAGQAQLPALQELSQLLLAVYRQVIDGHLEEEPALWAALEQGHNELLDLVDAVAASTDLPSVSEVVGEALRTLAQGDDGESDEDIDLAEYGIDSSEFTFGEEITAAAPAGTDEDERGAIAVDAGEDDDEQLLADLSFDDLLAAESEAGDTVAATAETEISLQLPIDSEIEIVDAPEMDADIIDPDGIEIAGTGDTGDIEPEHADVSKGFELSPAKTTADELSLDDLELPPALQRESEVSPAAAALSAEAPAVVAETDGELGATQRALLADIDPDVVEVFLEEAGDLMDELEELIQNWEQSPEDLTAPEALKRVLHTFKGGARMAALMGLGEVAHRFETVIENMQSGSSPSAAFFADAHRIYDRLASGVDTVRAWIGGEEIGPFCALLETRWADTQTAEDVEVAAELPPATPVVEEHTAAEVEEAGDLSDDDYTPPVEVIENVSVPATSPASNVLPFVRKSKNVGDRNGGQTRSQPQEMVRVASELLEELVNLAGETSISRGRLEEQVSEFGLALDEMDSTLSRLNEQLRRLDKETEAQIHFRQEQLAEQDVDFDPLEMDRYSSIQQLSRSLLESTSDLLELRQTLGNKARDTETLLLQQSRVNTELQEGLMRSRMVPFSRLVPRLRRIVRQVSAELGKQVDLVFSNVEGELDRSMLERMVAPLEHMLRNAVDHGIEIPQKRRDAGKPERGRISVALAREGSEVVITISDDGAGINLMRVREKAIESGLMRADAELSNNEIMQFILQAGFSTAEKVTQISGRGVGMDVVSAEIKLIGGSVTIGSQAGKGTEFVVRLPFTVSVNRALMVKVGDDLFALPLNTIEGIVRLSPFELEHYYRTPEARFEYAGEPYQVNYFGSLLQSSAQPRLAVEDMQMPVLLVRSENTAMALQVDAIMGSREIVVKSLGPQFAGVQGVSGATVTGDGTVVVILDAHALLRKHSALLARPEAPLLQHIGTSSTREEPEAQKLVMVVDDSVTVRKVTTRFLEREGYRVITAKDGQDAIIQLQDVIPDVMLLDIEMPRMDGFEVARNIRSSSRLRDIPIIMITSRTGKKHRDHALSLGVNHYLGKPYQEEILLGAIRDYTEAGVNA
ncbi:Hpt domain-containing protein [Microbulbifer pacificus]|uniref:hybrid sensor histidine kinase/response regulator n=1 Tax=Microbulbifer pacificus TaxID=407164 RepID=UPI000CF3E2FB|nr:Hpt domain-containing protein [Microbulbifer pacificus]